MKSFIYLSTGPIIESLNRMKKYISAFLFLLGCISLVNAQTSGPQMTFEKKMHDFGDITEGVNVKYTFTYTNTGTDTLVVSRVISSCGCTVPEDFTKVVPPGQKGTITVEFRSAGKVGIFTKSLTILNNMDTPEPILLYIRVNVLMPKP